MKFTVTLILLVSINVFSQTPCVEELAGSYPCNNLDLLSHMPLSTFGTTRGNDSWGWTDPDTGKEYVIFGNTQNAVFIDISDPINPIYLGKLDSHSNDLCRTWRDIKVYNNYAFFESGNIMISDRDNGVFIVRDSNSPLSINNNDLIITNLYPNPTKIN